MAGVLLVNREQRDNAMVVAMYATSISPDSLKTMYVEYATVDASGHIYDTNNSDQLSSFPCPEHKSLSQLPAVRDIETLYRIHHALLERDGVTISSKSYPLDSDWGGDVIEFLQESMRREFAEAEAAGYLRKASETHYRPTIKGAFLIVWKELWPAKMIRRQWRDRAASELLNDLQRQGFEITLS